MASWEGPAIIPGVNRSRWWSSRKQTFNELLNHAKQHLSASALAAPRLQSGDQTAGDSATQPGRTTPRALELRKRVRPSAAWVSTNAPRIAGLDASTPVPSPQGQHATRKIQAAVATPGGRVRIMGDEVIPLASL